MARTYEIRTYGCQMNVHDSERLAGLLEDAGYVGASDAARRSRRVQHLRRARERRQPALRQPGPPRAGQAGRPGHADRRRRLPGPEGPRPDRRAGAVGGRRVRHAQPGRAAGAARARPAQQARPQVEIVEALQDFPSELPSRRESPFSAWVSVSVGCDNTCTFCIVPSLRGTRDRPAPRRRAGRDPRARRHRRRRGDAARPERELLRPLVRRSAARSASCCAPAARSTGLERVRFTSPHPRDFTDDVHRRDGRDAERHAAAAHAAAVRVGRRAARDAPLLPARALPGDHRQGARRDAAMRRSPPTSSSASRARPRPTSSRRWTSCARPGSPARSRSSTPSVPARPRRPWPTRCRRPSCRSATSG